jgi:hypothetical protein
MVSWLKQVLIERTGRCAQNGKESCQKVVKIRLTTSQKRLIEVTLTAKPYPLTSPCFGVAKTSLSLRKERDVAQRQGEVTFSPFAFFELFSM